MSAGKPFYQIGVLPHDETAYKRVSFPEGARYASLVTVEKIKETAGIVGKLFSGRVSLKATARAGGNLARAGQALGRVRWPLSR